MKGIIIAGGLGTRLRPLTYSRPKPLVPVVNRPFLEYQVALLREHGIDDIVFATNYMADRIEGHFGDGSRFGVRMRYAIEETPLGTGGAIRNAADILGNETVAVFNGDVLTDFDLSAIVAFHRNRRAVATLALSVVPSPNPFGVLILDGDGRVSEWREPTEQLKKALAAGGPIEQTGVDHINAGFYVLERDFIDRIPAGVPRSVERDIYPAVLADGLPVYGIAPGGFWMDVGRPEQLMTASKAILSGAVKAAAAGIPIGPGASIAPGASVSEDSSVGAGSRVGEGSVLKSTVLMDNVQLGVNVRLNGVVIDENVIIEDDVVLEVSDISSSTPVVAAGSILKRGSRFID